MYDSFHMTRSRMRVVYLLGIYLHCVKAVSRNGQDLVKVMSRNPDIPAMAD